MSDEPEDDDKQFEATQHKLDEARKKGDFPRSIDLNTAAAYAGILVVGLSIGAGSLVQIGSNLAGYLGKSVILSIIAQRGFVFAPTKLEPKLSRISPVSQAKNKFGRNGLFEFGKSFAKLVLYSTVLFLFLAGRLPDIMSAMALSPGQVIATLLQLCISLMSIVLVIALALGVAPECVAKGVDLVAAQIREVAQENAVPIHSDPPTARALYATVEIGDQIPKDHYKTVAAAIRFADKIRKVAR